MREMIDAAAAHEAIMAGRRRADAARFLARQAWSDSKVPSQTAGVSQSYIADLEAGAEKAMLRFSSASPMPCVYAWRISWPRNF
jgi:hypothetical protein